MADDGRLESLWATSEAHRDWRAIRCHVFSAGVRTITIDVQAYEILRSKQVGEARGKKVANQDQPYAR